MTIFGKSERVVTLIGEMRFFFLLVLIATRRKTVDGIASERFEC
jgi:hypothetical protein